MAGTGATPALAEVIVTAERRPQPRLMHAGSIAVLGGETIRDTRHQHIAQLLQQVPGVWIVRGSGQEHQTAIRSPVLGGGGSCGGFLILEDGIPVRPASFCHINQLFEVFAEQAASIEVIRGPATAVHGSNALHGVVNVVMPAPDSSSDGELALELGANDFLRFQARLPHRDDADWLAAMAYASDGGFRDQSGYRQGKLHLKRRWAGTGQAFFLAATATGLEQETAGFITGEGAYRDRRLSRQNPAPGAFRDAGSLRVYGGWQRQLPGVELDLRPYLRHSQMEFMHHELPGRPVEDNGQTSAGILAAAHFALGGSRLVAGLDLEWSDAFLRQRQDQPAEGSPRQVATRPVGRHYDYRVEGLSAGLFVQATLPLGDAVTLGGGLRADYLHNDYRNHLPAGNTRDDGRPCGFGGCFYTRPASRSDAFDNLAPNLSAIVRLGPATTAFLSAARGFRVPQSLELYRLQSGQLQARLAPERSDGIEAGLRVVGPELQLDLAAFLIDKRDSVFRDASGFTVTGARSRHRGLEAGLHWQLAPAWQLDAAASYARHVYDFNATAAGQTYVSGNDVDTAPRLLASLGLNCDCAEGLQLGLSLQQVGDYYLDPANRFRYGGHAVAGFRARYRIAPRLEVALRINNLLDERYADRADHGAGTFRYLPGREREVFLEIRVRPGE